MVILTRNLRDVPAGSRGIITDITSRSINISGQMQKVKTVMCDFGGEVVEVGRMRFSVFDAMGEEISFCEQQPLLLGRAITVHRAQGLTLDAVEIDFQLGTWSTCALVYTALSRVRSLSSLRVRGLQRHLIRVSMLAFSYYQASFQENGIDPAHDGRPAEER